MTMKMERGSTPRIRPVTHVPALEGGTRAKYCGPAAMSAISGQPAEVCNAWINYHRRRPLYYQSQGVGYGLLRDSLRDLGWSIHKIPVSATLKDGTVKDELVADWQKGKAHHLTLAKWLRSRSGKTRGEVYLLLVSEAKPHWIVVQGQKTADSWRNALLHVKDSPHRRKRIIEIYLVMPFGTDEESAKRRRLRTPFWPPKDYRPKYVKTREWGYVKRDDLSMDRAARPGDGLDSLRRMFRF